MSATTEKAAEQADVLVLVTVSAVGVGNAGDRLTVSAEHGSQLVAMGVAVFADGELQEAWRASSAHVDPDVLEAQRAAALEAAELERSADENSTASKEGDDGGTARARVRESRPRSS